MDERVGIEEWWQQLFEVAATKVEATAEAAVVRGAGDLWFED